MINSLCSKRTQQQRRSRILNSSMIYWLVLLISTIVISLVLWFEYLCKCSRWNQRVHILTYKEQYKCCRTLHILIQEDFKSFCKESLWGKITDLVKASAYMKSLSLRLNGRKIIAFVFGDIAENSRSHCPRQWVTQDEEFPICEFRRLGIVCQILYGTGRKP